jgi:heme/copper-type cytochrome/quinol oxidase subunit 2
MTGDGTSSAMTDGAQSSVTMDQNSTGSPPNAMQHASSAQGASASADAGPPSADARVIDVAVESFKFMPNVIAIKKGEKVVIHLKGLSGSHGFMVADLGINVPIAADETKDVTIPTDKAETFSFRCSVPCGPGHRDMRGTITIS